MTRMTRSWVVLGVATLAFAAAGAALGSRMGTGESAFEAQGGADDAEWGDLFSLPEILAASEVVVIVKPVSQRDDMIVSRSAASGQSMAEVVEHVDVVEVIEVLKGSVAPGDQLSVYQSAGTARERGQRPARRTQYETIPLMASQEYVLFLRSVPRPPVYPGTEELIWIRPGEPGVAQIEGDRLQFLATQRYQTAVGEKGLKAPEGQLGVPFSATLSELRAGAQGAK